MMDQGAQTTAAVGARIARLRGGMRWSQRELARVAGVPQAMLSRLENGAQDDVTLGAVLRIADALDVDVEVLLGRRPLPARSATAARVLGAVRSALAEDDPRRSRGSGKPLHDPLSSTDYNNLKADAANRIEAHLAGALVS